PLGEIELVAATGIARGFGPRPRAQQFSICRRQRVAGDAKRLCVFAVDAGKCAGEVQTVLIQLGEILFGVEFAVEDSAIVLGGSDENRWLAVEQEVVRVIGMKRKWSLRSMDASCDGQENDRKNLFH